MNFIVLSAMLPVVGLIAIGFVLGRSRLIGPAAVKPLSRLSFSLLTPVLLFRTMSTVHLEQIDLRPAGAYILALALAFAGTLLLRGLNRTAAVLALAVTYSNAVMIGIPLVTLAWGQAGLVTLLILIPVHSLLLLTSATVALEFVLAREQVAACGNVVGHIARVAGRALYKAALHPVPLPIIAGLLFAQTGLRIPPWLDLPMRWMGNAFSPLALMLVGIALAGASIGAQWRGALMLSGVKNLLIPAVAALLGWVFGMEGLALTVLVVTAALPIGANVFMFSQRYAVAEELVTASVAVSTMLGLVSVSLIMLLMGWLQGQ